MGLLNGSSDRIPVLGKPNRNSSRNDGRVSGVRLSGNYNNRDADFDGLMT